LWDSGGVNRDGKYFKHSNFIKTIRLKKSIFSLKKILFLLFLSVCLGFLEKLFYQKNLF